MRLLFVTLEFSAGTFSGNGVYAQSQVRALRAQGHEVLVLAGRPAGRADAATPSGQLEVSLPVWGRLDEQCGWREFAAGAAAEPVATAVVAFEPQSVLGVDWHALGAWRGLRQRLGGAAAALPYIYLNYRVYCRTAAGEAHALLRQLEREAVEAAAATVCLSRSDAAYIREHLQPGPGAAPPQVLLPALQAAVEAVPPPADVHEALQSGAEAAQQRQGRQLSQRQGFDAVQHSGSIGQQSPGGGELSHQSSDAARQYGSMVQQQQQQQRRLAYGGPSRRYLTCCVRLSPEKEPERFVAAIEALAGLCSSAAAGAAAGDGLCNGSGGSGGNEADGGSCGSSTHLPAGARQPAADGLLNGIQPAGAAPHGDDHAAAEAAEAGDPAPNNVASENRLQRLGVTPLLCGSATTEYAQELKARLRAASPDSVIQERFLSPTELAKVYAATKLNVHPCRYDAYGMTVVEVASQGAPSLVAAGGAVGATDLLSAAAGECCGFDMEQPAGRLADEIERLLQDGSALGVVGARAACKARSWTEAANAAELMCIVQAAACGSGPTQH